MKEINESKLLHYFKVTQQALQLASKEITNSETAKDFLDMATRYYSDANYFYKHGNFVNAFAAINYAHGWLDAGARIGLFKVKDSKLFAVDSN